VGVAVDTNFLNAHAGRYSLLAENVDNFTKRRLFDLAARQDKRVWVAEPSVATRFSHSTLNTTDVPR
jgi:hypothetical protein